MICLLAMSQVGGQEHFYLEPNNCVVIPHENEEYTIYASTQASQVWLKCGQVQGLTCVSSGCSQSSDCVVSGR